MYGEFIGCYKEELHQELLDFLEYRESVEACELEPQNGEQEKAEEISISSSPILEVLANSPKRFVNVRKLLHIAATMPLTSCVSVVLAR